MSFDHRTDGTSAQLWDELVAGVERIREPRAGDRLTVVAAHPDDETLGAGGLIASASSRGARVTVVVATDGGASHPDSPTHSPDQLASIRRREVYDAVAVLAPDAEVHLLGLPDGELAKHEDDLEAALEPLLDGCTYLVTPWSHDRHPDHEASGRVAARLAATKQIAHWQYPIWAWHWGEPATLADLDLRAVQLDEAAIESKARALRCHVSQHQALSDAAGDEALLSPAMLEHFRRPIELFLVAGNRGLTPLRYFDELYAQASDPWGLDARFYEHRKRAALLAALTRPRFRRAFEPGCATGALTTELARRCDEVVAWDAVATAVDQAAPRFADDPSVTIARGQIPGEWPAGSFDLIVLSEVGYYCADLTALTARIDGSLEPDGVLVGCHWRHPASMHAHGAGAVHAALGSSLHLVVSHVEDDFLLQLWTRSGQSVAAAEGIVA